MFAIRDKFLTTKGESSKVRCALSHKVFDEIKGNVDKDVFKCADPGAAEEMAKVIERAKEEGDSVGGVI